MKGFSKKFLIMGGGLFIILLIVYMHMRNKEGFQPTPLNLPDLKSNSWNKCGVFCLNSTKINCLTMCGSQNIDFCKNLGLKPETRDFNHCLNTGNKPQSQPIYSESLSARQNVLNRTSAFNNWKNFSYVPGSTISECKNNCKSLKLPSKPELMKCYDICDNNFKASIRP
jgi:hypothetical protein